MKIQLPITQSRSKESKMRYGNRYSFSRPQGDALYSTITASCTGITLAVAHRSGCVISMILEIQLLRLYYWREKMPTRWNWPQRSLNRTNRRGRLVNKWRKQLLTIKGLSCFMGTDTGRLSVTHRSIYRWYIGIRHLSPDNLRSRPTSLLIMIKNSPDRRLVAWVSHDTIDSHTYQPTRTAQSRSIHWPILADIYLQHVFVMWSPFCCCYFY